MVRAGNSHSSVFCTEREVDEAIKFFNNSYLDTCRITCEKDAVGEKDVKRVLVEQSVEGISEEDIDPDRFEVRFDLPDLRSTSIDSLLVVRQWERSFSSIVMMLLVTAVGDAC